MDLLTILICIGSLLIGGLVTWIIMRSCKREKSLLQPTAEEDTSKLKEEIKCLQNRLEDSQTQVADFEKKTTQITEKLRTRELELANLQKEFEGLANSSPEERTEAVLANLKKELEKKSNEIKDNEEEIEELEDELAAVKKKLSKAKSEIQETSELLEKSTLRLKKTEQELEDVTFLRDELQTENNIQAEAIEFVNAILTANPANDKDAQLIDNKVSQIESIINENYIPLLDNEEYYKNWEKKEEWKQSVKKDISYWANLQRKSWLKGKKVVAFIGEFSAGKTSIVNRILTQDNPDCPTLPVSSKATTAIATYISYGEGFLSQFTDKNGDLRNLSREMFLKVNKDILSKINASSLMRHFVMKYKNENLRGLSILDTPGFSSTDSEDQDRTLEVIMEADALFWVMDANTGDINKTSLKVISENIHDIPLYIIINKADTKSPGELEKLEAHVRQTMQRAQIKVNGYVRFSQVAKIDELMKIIKSLKSRRENDDAKKIFIDIQSDIIHFNEELIHLQKDIRNKKTSLEEFKENIIDYLDSLKDCCHNMGNLPQLNNRWFRDDDYRMDKHEYQEFVRCKDDVLEGCDNINIVLPTLLEDQYELIQSMQWHNQCKELHSKLSSLQNLIMNAIKAFDPELHKALIYAFTNIQLEETVSKFDYDEEDCRDNRSDEYSETDASGGYEAFQKAIMLQRQDKNEEAKFWFIRSAKLGYREGIVYCNKSNYQF